MHIESFVPTLYQLIAIVHGRAWAQVLKHSPYCDHDIFIGTKMPILWCFMSISSWGTIGSNFMKNHYPPFSKHLHRLQNIGADIAICHTLLPATCEYHLISSHLFIYTEPGHALRPESIIPCSAFLKWTSYASLLFSLKHDPGIPSFSFSMRMRFHKRRENAIASWKLQIEVTCTILFNYFVTNFMALENIYWTTLWLIKFV